MGSSMQLMPANKLPLNANKKKTGKLVIINLQPTLMDDKADLVIHNLIDECMGQLMRVLHLNVPEYNECQDVTRIPSMIGSIWSRKTPKSKKLADTKESRAQSPTPNTGVKSE